MSLSVSINLFSSNIVSIFLVDLVFVVVLFLMNFDECLLFVCWSLVLFGMEVCIMDIMFGIFETTSMSFASGFVFSLFGEVVVVKLIIIVFLLLCLLLVV